MVALVVEVEVTRMGTMTALTATLMDTQDLETIQHLMPADTAVVTAMVEVTDIPTVTPTAPLGATAQDRTEVILVAQVTRWLT